MYAQAASQAASVDHEAENRLKRELARMTEERDILKRPQRSSRRMQNEVRDRGRASPAVFGACEVSVPQHSSQRVLSAMIDKVVLTPNEAGDALTIDLIGDLAGTVGCCV